MYIQFWAYFQSVKILQQIIHFVVMTLLRCAKITLLQPLLLEDASFFKLGILSNFQPKFIKKTQVLWILLGLLTLLERNCYNLCNFIIFYTTFFLNIIFLCRVEHYVYKCGDVQTAAMLACVFNNFETKLSGMKNLSGPGNNSVRFLLISILNCSLNLYFTILYTLTAFPFAKITEGRSLLNFLHLRALFIDLYLFVAYLVIDYTCK